MLKSVGNCMKKINDKTRLARTIMDQVIEEMCDKYCKYPEIWEKEHPGEDLSEYGPCAVECPLNRL